MLTQIFANAWMQAIKVKVIHYPTHERLKEVIKLEQSIQKFRSSETIEQIERNRLNLFSNPK
jgi:hypothetical protein